MLMKHVLVTAMVLFTCLDGPVAAERHTMRGLVLKVDPATRTMFVSHEAVRGVMDAMVMPFAVRQADALKGLTPGTTIEFTSVTDESSAYAENIRVRGFESLEQKPLELRRLKFLNSLANPASKVGILEVGQHVPDFALIDQAGQRVAFSSLAGKVVALTFGYIACPNPAYCFRLANNLGQLQKRFASRMGRDLVLLTIVLDPEHDQKDALADYATIWTATPQVWHFLTGPLPEIQRVSHLFGVEFWKDEGSIIHSFDTVVIDRHGTLAASLEGNEFTAAQLGDLVQTVMERR